jgi:YHS domain-containing protein
MQAFLTFILIFIVLFLVIIFIIAALGASFLLSSVRILLSPFRKKADGKGVVVGADGQPVTDVMVKDPVCGMYLPRGDAIRETIDGRTFYFCSQECLSEYKTRA